MSDAVRRAIRTFAQSFLGAFAASGVLSAFAEAGVVDWTVLKKAGISALIAGIIALMSFIQNALEDSGAIPAPLKAPASEGVNPVPDDGGSK